MNDPVDRLLAEREAMDRGLPGGVMLSFLGHVVFIGGAFGAALLAPRQPPLKVIDGFVVPLPPGGLGQPAAAAPAAVPEPAPSEAPPAPKVEPPPKVIKPPKEEPRKGLPEPDARRVKARPEPTAPPRGASSAHDRAPGRSPAAATPGFEVAPPGPGVPGGTDMMGDWYLAGVQRKVWTIWIQQIKANFAQPITVQFTILADGSLDEDIRVLETSGVPLLDLAAKRAIYNAAPFGPLPKHYATNRFTIQGVFKPAP